MISLPLDLKLSTTLPSSQMMLIFVLDKQLLPKKNHPHQTSDTRHRLIASVCSSEGFECRILATLLDQRSVTKSNLKIDPGEAIFPRKKALGAQTGNSFRRA